MSFAVTLPPLSYYEGLADELDSIAAAVTKNPKLCGHFAGRLNEIAQQLRDDTKLMALRAR
jgi:hypothetical protein